VYKPNLSAAKCECGTLEYLSNEPSIPIVFDADLNEYHVVGASRQKVMIHHCFFCGGLAPPSRRGDLFMHITQEELARLMETTRDLKTPDDVIGAFGQADSDRAHGMGVTKRESSADPARATYYRQMTYHGLSDTADLNVIVGLNDQVQFSFTQKPKKHD